MKHNYMVCLIFQSLLCWTEKKTKNLARKAHFTAQHTLCLNKEIDQTKSEVVDVCIKRHSQFLNLLYTRIPLSQSFYITAPRCGGLLHVRYCYSFENTR
jgi:hypothetical protein